MPLTLDVTRRALTLGSQDSVTGWYARNFSESTIEMVILPRNAASLTVGMGLYPKYTLSGFTQDPVEVGDEIIDAAENYYEIKTVEEYYLCNSFLYRECELAKMQLHWDIPSSYGSAPTMQDPRQRGKTWMDTYLDADALTENDDSTPVTFITCWANPPYPISKVLLSKGVDLVYTVAVPDTEPLPLGVGYIENTPIAIYTVDKTNILGEKLRWKAENELRRIAREHPLGSLRTVSRVREATQNLGSTTLYSVTLNLRYKRYA